MFTKAAVVAIALMAPSLALAGSPSIGTVSTRGEILVGGYPVRGTATLFDNIAVETNQFAATMRLDEGTEIKLGTRSSGTLYQGRLVLSRGETQLTSTAPFRLEARGLRIVPGSADANGIVSLNAEKVVQVATIRGTLRVLDNQGVQLAEVNSGSALSFPADPRKQDSSSHAAGAPPQAISDIGLLSLENGHYYLTSSLSQIKYEISGKNLEKYVGDKVVINGDVLAGTVYQPVSVEVRSIGINGGNAGFSTLGKILFGAALAGDAATIGYLVASASR